MTSPKFREMFGRLLIPEKQSRAARTVEIFGWLDLALGIVIFLAPHFVESLLLLPTLTEQGANYLRLAGLLVSGLGMLYVVSGRLNAQGFVFASMLDRPLVPLVMAVLWYRNVLPGPLALAFSITDFGGFLWTLWAWRLGDGAESTRPGLLPRVVAGFFGFMSGVVRNARTFHPDGRTLVCTVRSLQPADPSLARATAQLSGLAFIRMGMGLLKNGMPKWLANSIPDAPSIATRFSCAATPEGISLQLRQDGDLDLLCTAGGDRLWKLILNLALGGKMYGLQQFDYFRNVYYAQVPYRVDQGALDVWIRLVPNVDSNRPRPIVPKDSASREEDLTNAVSNHAVVRIEAQPVAGAQKPFVPIAEIRFDAEIQIDQEALHFDPVAGRGFVPHGFLTDLRKTVYPTSAGKRPANQRERRLRDEEGFVKRLLHYFRS